MAFITGLLVGTFFGTVFALLFAPEAGEELRQKIQSGAEANWQKASQELDRVKHKNAQPLDEALETQSEV